MDLLRKYLKLMTLGAAMLFTLHSHTAVAQGGNYNSDYYDDGYGNGSYQDFYNDLSPYGEWISDPQYGYVWIPDVGANFRPYYTNGYWVMTNYGNTWVSNYPWGWAAFHYGRWTFDNYYGWVWIPGNEWGPAWVNWRSVNNGYYGWAPMGPGANIGFYDNGYYAPSFWWTFASQQYLYHTNLYSYVRSPRYYNDYLRRSQLIRESHRSNNYSYFAGPRRGDIERATGRSITVYNINNSRRAGATRVGDASINIYRPRITASSNSNIRPQRVQQGSIRIARESEQSPRQQRAAQTSIRPTRFDRTNNGMQLTESQRAELQPQRSQQVNDNNRQRVPDNRQGGNETQIRATDNRQQGQETQVPQQQFREQQRAQQEQQRAQQRAQEQQQRAQQEQQRQMRIQQQDQQRAQRQQMQVQQEQQRAQQQQQQQIRAQQEQMRAQQEQQRAQQQQMRDRQEQMRVQQEQQRAQQQQLRNQQEQQRAQQQQQMQQQRAQQEQQRSLQQQMRMRESQQQQGEQSRPMRMR